MIEVTNLTKKFGSKYAVHDLSFTVEKGEVLGFLGPNGAGKSTTMRMITGFIPVGRGSIRVCGLDVEKEPERVKDKIGYLPESAPLYPEMSVTSFLGFCASARGMRGKARKEAIERVIETCFLQKVAHQTIDTLSKGFRHRTCLAQSLLHDPEVLVLDEPTDGLDPNQKHEVRNLIRDLGKEKSILFSTHILEEVDAACSRVVIVDQGKIVENGTPAELRTKSECQSLHELFRKVTTKETTAA
ncbi:ABC transporter ATP-binding protein [Rubritalea spongiae]|uniref:ABC transporter ATP-binding protein n=1 Tax=Rubritalea spongiae TaxID=430797 RepID=A0ABW5E2L6_9BACT